VVVIRITAVQRPESVVYRVGIGTRTPPTRCVDAACHQPVPQRNAAMPRNEARVETGSSAMPEIGLSTPGAAPDDRALVKALYGA
jgi:hypothetical protein